MIRLARRPGHGEAVRNVRTPCHRTFTDCQFHQIDDPDTMPAVSKKFLCAAALVTLSLVVAYFVGLDSERAAREIGKERETIGHLNGLLCAVTSAETGQRGYL